MKVTREELERVDSALNALKEATWFFRFVQQQEFPPTKAGRTFSLTPAQSSQLQAAVEQVATALSDLGAAIEPLRRRGDDGADATPDAQA